MDHRRGPGRGGRLHRIAPSHSPVGDSSAVELTEFGIEAEAQVLNEGTVAFSITNSGEFPHTFVITERMGAVATATDLIPAGEVIDLSLRLPRGNYVSTCRIVAQTESGRLVDHYEEGMVTGFSVRA